MSLATYGYAPYLRPGALLFTLAAFRYSQKGRKNHHSILIDLSGSAGGRKRNLFGEHVAAVSLRAFGASVQPKDILLRHTFYGVYSRTLSLAASNSWAEALIVGGRSFHAKVVLRGFAPTKRLSLATRNLRSCFRCVSDDIDAHGFGQWRILHQVPSLLYCPEHGVPLSDEVIGSSAGNLWPYALPRGLRSECKHETAWAASDGHSTYLELWTRLFDGELPVLTSHAWAVYMGRIVSSFGNLASAQGEIEDTIRRMWSMDVPRIRSKLGPHIEEDFVQLELSHNSAPVRVPQKLIVLSAASALGISPVDVTDSSQLRLGLASGEHTSANPIESGCVTPFLMSGFPGRWLQPCRLTEALGRWQTRPEFTAGASGKLWKEFQTSYSNRFPRQKAGPNDPGSRSNSKDGRAPPEIRSPPTLLPGHWQVPGTRQRWPEH